MDWIIFFFGIVIGCCIAWPFGKSYGETEAETKWLRTNAERQVKAAKVTAEPSYEVFDKKVAAKLKKSVKPRTIRLS